MIVQIYTGFPLFQQDETVLVFDIAKDGIAQPTGFLSRRFNHGEKRLRQLFLSLVDSQPFHTGYCGLETSAGIDAAKIGEPTFFFTRNAFFLQCDVR